MFAAGQSCGKARRSLFHIVGVGATHCRTCSKYPGSRSKSSNLTRCDFCSERTCCHVNERGFQYCTILTSLGRLRRDTGLEHLVGKARIPPIVRGVRYLFISFIITHSNITNTTTGTTRGTHTRTRFCEYVS